MFFGLHKEILSQRVQSTIVPDLRRQVVMFSSPEITVTVYLNSCYSTYLSARIQWWLTWSLMYHVTYTPPMFWAEGLWRTKTVSIARNFKHGWVYSFSWLVCVLSSWPRLELTPLREVCVDGTDSANLLPGTCSQEYSVSPRYQHESVMRLLLCITSREKDMLLPSKWHHNVVFHRVLWQRLHSDLK